MTPVVASIGTTHPLHVAGLGLTLRIAERLGVRAVSVVAGVSAQDRAGVHARTAVDPVTIAAQCAALADADVRAIHVGALLDRASVEAVAAGLAPFAGIPVVCDPVIAASTGEPLADDAAVTALREVLFGRCALVTPNVHEAARVLDSAGAPVQADTAAHALLATGAAAVLVTGGDRAGTPADVLAAPGGITYFRAERLAGSLRGTGDALAFAIAARLAHGDTLHAAIDAARRFVRAEIGAGVDFAGMRAVR